MITTTALLYPAAFLFSRLPYDPIRDFAFISRLTNGGLILVAPAGTPPQALAKLETAARNAAQLPSIRNKLLSEGVGVVGSTSEELRRHFVTSLPSVERLVKVSGAKAEGPTSNGAGSWIGSRRPPAHAPARAASFQPLARDPAVAYRPFGPDPRCSHLRDTFK